MIRYVAAALLTAGLVVGVLPDLVGLDRQIRFAQLVAFRPWLLLGTAVLAVLLAGLTWFRRGAWPFAAGAVAVSLAGAALVVPRAVPSAEPAAGTGFTVVAFNTYEGRADAATLAELVRDEQPDVVALSEAGDRFGARIAPLVGPMGYRLVVAAPGRADVESVAVLVATRLGDPAATVGHDSALFPYIELSGGGLGSLRVVAFHVAAPVPGRFAGWTSDMALLGRWCTGSEPVIVAGDLNATLDHSALRAGMRGCADAAAQRGDGLVPTWGPGGRARFFGPQIDHVLVGGGVTATAFDVRDVPGSDHRAVAATLRLP